MTEMLILLTIALVTGGLMTYVLYLVFSDDRGRLHDSRTPPRSHAPDEFEPEAYHRAA